MHFSPKLIHDTMLFFNFFFLCKWHILFYHAYWIQVFLLFQFSFFQEQRINYSEDHVIFQDIEHQLQENILHHFLY